MPNDPVSRRYVPAGADAVWHLHDRALVAAGWEFVGADPPGDPVTEAHLGIVEGHLEKGGGFLVGTVEGEPVGIGGVVPIDEETVELRRMAVDPVHQGWGLGRHLLGELEDRAAAQGYGVVTLETVTRLERARRLYERAGYVEVARDHHDRTGDDRVRYRKVL